METMSKICLIGAKTESKKDAVLAEKLFRRALEAGARYYGIKSAELGLILVEFAAFLENQNRLLEAELIYVRVHDVLKDVCLNNCLYQPYRRYPSGLN